MTRAFEGPIRPWNRSRTGVVALLAAVALAGTPIAPAVAQDAAADDAAETSQSVDDTDAPADDEAASEESGVALPTDRLKERQLDRVRRLVDDGRWSDSATLVDEILGGDRDFFFRPRPGESTWRSIKSEASRLLGAFPAAGRQAYELQFRSRADRTLDEALKQDDRAGVVSVARRWFHTPAGRRATLLSAIDALDRGRPLEAAAWLERLASAPGAGEFEPTSSVMRAIAWWRAGDRRAAATILDGLRAARVGTVRLGGREVAVTYPDGGAAEWLEKVAGAPSSGVGRGASEWWVHRGDPARNALVEASRPLLVPRYRVPLTRHPEEARLLERRRKSSAERDMPLLPAGSPLAVDGVIVTHTPMGLLAVDFDTGKRIWLQTAGAAGSFFDAGTSAGDDPDESGNAEANAAIRGVFDDSTSGTLSSDGALVFAVESDPASLAGPGLSGLDMFRQFSTGPRGSNALSAYRLNRGGELAWRISGAAPAPPGAEGQGPPQTPQQVWRQQQIANGLVETGGRWFLGAPLPIGDQLFVLVEERGEVRLDVLSAADGGVVWSQPLAELDEGISIVNRESHLRRVGGLTPSFSDGVLVCPTGAGTVVAVDLATRTLSWAYNYAKPRSEDGMVLANGVRIQRGGMGGLGGGMIINGRFVAASGGPAAESGWRDGSPVLSAGRIVLTPRESDELHCLDLRSGSLLWRQPRRDGMYVAGVVDDRIVLVGRDAVTALALADGSSAWSEPVALGGSSPSGRGLITARRLFLPLDTPEVVEIDLVAGGIAGRAPGRGGQVIGNLVAYRGEVVSQGVDSLDVFHQSEALEKRIETARATRPEDAWVALWRGQMDIDRGDVAGGLGSIAAAHAAAPDSVPVSLVRDALHSGLERDFAAALPFWDSWGERIGGVSRPLLRSVVDGHLRAGRTGDAWRVFTRLLDAGNPPPEPAAEAAFPDPSDRGATLTEPAWIAGRFRRMLERAGPGERAAIDADVGASFAAAEAIRPVAERLARLSDLDGWFAGHPAAERARAGLRAALEDMITISGATSDAGRDLSLRRDSLPATEAAVADPGAADPAVAWPFGRVKDRRVPAASGNDDANRIARMVPIPIEGAERSAVPGLRLAFDIQQPAFVVTDGLGRRIGEPFAIEPRGRGDAWAGFQPYAAEASIVGRVVVVRSGALLFAFEVARQAGLRHRRLWVIDDHVSSAPEMAAMPFLGRGLGNGPAGLGNLPLGGIVSEPDGAIPVQTMHVGPARPAGLPILVNSSLEFRDTVTGRLRWARHRLPAAGELVGDDEYLCVIPRSGRGATVVSTVDGSLVRTCDLPDRRARLLSHGRRLVVVGDGRAGGGDAVPGPAGGRVRLSLVDPVTMESVSLGEFGRDARAFPAGSGELAVLEPSGALAVFGLTDGAEKFRTRLAEMPDGLEQFRVMPWQDRYLVFVGRRETAEERTLLDKVGAISGLPQQFSREVTMPATGSLWAVDRESGAMLWPVPATILRHCIHPGQPEALPVLLFARQFQRRGSADRQRLGILCLDKRTGQALFLDDKLGTQPQFLAGCELSGDPEARTVSIATGGGDGRDIVLEFTGQPSAPAPPFQAAARLPVSRDVLSELESWLERVIQLPIPSF